MHPAVLTFAAVLAFGLIPWSAPVGPPSLADTGPAVADPGRAVMRAKPSARSGKAQIAVTLDSGRIAIVNAKGRRLKTIPGPAGWLDSAPAWSPDGKRIAFTRSQEDSPYEFGNFQIYVAKPGRTPRKLTKGRHDARPAWSPDGRWLAFESDLGLALIRSNGKGRRLVPEARYGKFPAWSPKGQIAYTWHGTNEMWWPPECEDPAEGCGVIWRSSLNGSKRKRITSGSQPDWSPNGRVIVLTLLDGHVATLPAKKHRSKALRLGSDAEWSANGKSIVFTLRGDLTDNSVWIMRKNGTAAKQFLAGASEPTWRPTR